jgi:hypothetical protein
VPPLGYDVRDHCLIINEAEAPTVKLIYELYLKLGSVRLLKHELDRRGVISKLRVSRKGSPSGGLSFSRGALYELLANPVYVGQVRHRKQVHPGQHPLILERSLWAKIQHRLRVRAAPGARTHTKAAISPLAGKLFDEDNRSTFRERPRESVDTATTCHVHWSGVRPTLLELDGGYRPWRLSEWLSAQPRPSSTIGRQCLPRYRNPTLKFQTSEKSSNSHPS